MTKFILGKKLGMTTLYDENKGALNMTLIECPKNEVTLIREEEKDGYVAVQVSLKNSKGKSKLREFRISNEEKDSFKKGDKITVEKFEINEEVNATAISKAKGFQGVVKRHGFHGSPASHGHRHDLRAPGSIGSAYPQRVVKGKKMAGRMGGVQCTTKNLKVVYIDKEKNLIGLQGAVPGVSGRMVELFV